jgi:hypothetical protein
MRATLLHCALPRCGRESRDQVERLIPHRGPLHRKKSTFSRIRANMSCRASLGVCAFLCARRGARCSSASIHIFLSACQKKSASTSFFSSYSALTHRAQFSVVLMRLTVRGKFLYSEFIFDKIKMICVLFFKFAAYRVDANLGMDFSRTSHLVDSCLFMRFAYAV